MPTGKRSHTRRARGSSRAHRTITRKRNLQTGAGIWNRIRTLPGIRYITKKKLEKTASTYCKIQGMAVISKFGKSKQAEIAPLTNEEATCLINKHKAAKAHIFAYYIFNESTNETPCPSYEIKYMTKHGEQTIEITESVLITLPNQVSSQAPHVKYIIGKKVSEKVHERNLTNFGISTRPSIDAVVEALKFIFSNIGENDLEVVKLHSIRDLDEKTTVSNFIESNNVNDIIQRLNKYINSINNISGLTCATLETDKLFNEYRILSNALDESPSNASTIPIYFYTYDNPSDHVFDSDKYNKMQFIKLTGSSKGIKPPSKLHIQLQADTQVQVFYNDFLKNKPNGEYILILKRSNYK